MVAEGHGRARIRFITDTPNIPEKVAVVRHMCIKSQKAPIIFSMSVIPSVLIDSALTKQIFVISETFIKIRPEDSNLFETGRKNIGHLT